MNWKAPVSDFLGSKLPARHKFSILITRANRSAPTELRPLSRPGWPKESDGKGGGMGGEQGRSYSRRNTICEQLSGAIRQSMRGFANAGSRASRRATLRGRKRDEDKGGRPVGRGGKRTRLFRRLIKKARRAGGAVRPRVNRYLSRRRCYYRRIGRFRLILLPFPP